jgi:hypothetical protein
LPFFYALLEETQRKKTQRNASHRWQATFGKQLREAQLDYEMGEGERWTKEESN